MQIPDLTDRDEISDDQLDALRVAVLTEQERRYTIASAPAQLDAIQHAQEAALGITPPADGEPWDADVTYRRGAHVTHDGISYTSIAPFNRGWQPDQTTGHAWVRDAPEPDGDTPAPWTSGVAYQPGDLVTHDGKTWRARIAHTAHDDWAPSIHTHAVWDPA